MNNLLLIYETFTNGYRDIILDIFFLASVLCGIFVIISKNPIISVLFLIGLFLSIANILLVLGLSFIGLSYLLVYVGAVSILFLFILMLINVRVSELVSNTSNSIPLAILIAISFIYPFYQTLLYYELGFFNHLYAFLNFPSYLEDKIVFVSSKLWDGNLAEMSHIASIGNIMYSTYSIWLIITSIILLLAMVGAIIITINKKY
uniref:NADH-ubiquinone oxidoreductase chain 6 n=1 Tax=Lecanora saxigena TaxID=1585466 RepID=A0A482JW47_9LECA|nr:NADH dehydrogenase subunit 6 [Lecanora saxigena]QBP39474.1 NADH dehydrogenase subunit 6 [Lecanora saxigena]